MIDARPKIAHVAAVDLTLYFLLRNQLKALQQEGYAVAGVSSPGSWAPSLQDEGIEHYPIPTLGRGWTPLADMKAFIALVRLFRREQFTIVHTHTTKGGVLGSLAARLSGRVPIVVNTVHGIFGSNPNHPILRWLYLTLECITGRAAHFEFSQSRADLDLLLHLGITGPDRSAYLGNGVDLDHFDPDAVNPTARDGLSAELGLQSGAPVVGTVGRLVLEKGYREFVAAAEYVRRARPETAFLAIGPADDVKGDALPRELIRYGEAHGVRFLGMRTDMRELYSMMDLFVLASYREGFPRAAIEAAAMAKPLILTDISGCREVVTAERNGLLVPAQEVGPLADAILRLLDDDALRQRFGDESRKRALEEFDEKRVIGRVISVYRDLLAEKGMKPRARKT